MDKIVIYTAIFGNFDRLLEPEVQPNNIKYVCFTDQNIESEHWEIRKKVPLYDEPVRDSRRYKMMPHVELCGDADISVWIDGTFLVKKDITPLVEKYLASHDMACFSHNQTALDPHNCIYVSADYILELGEKNYNIDPSKGINAYKDDPKLIKSQIQKYRDEGYPEDNGLVISGIIMRRHSMADVCNLNQAWWNEIKRHSHICQLSLPYVCWKNNFEFAWIDGDIRTNEYLLHQGKHTKKSVKRGLAPISEEYFLNMELQPGGGGKERITNDHTLKTVREVVEFYKIKENFADANTKLEPSNWQYFNTVLAEFRHDVEDHHVLGWENMTEEYFNSKTVMLDYEIETVLMEDPVEFGNGYIKHGWHRACAMIGRLINGKSYIPFYVDERYIHNEIRQDDGHQRVFPMTENVENIHRLDQIQDHITICQSGILAVMGIRKNDDLDIIISSQLRQEHFDGNREFISQQGIEIFEPNKSKFNVFGAHGDDDLITNYSIIINGYRFLEPRFYFSRKNKTSKRDKHDWKLIKEFFDKGNHLGYPYHNITEEQWGMKYV